MPITVFIADDDSAAVATLAELLVHVAGVRIAGTADSEMVAADWMEGDQQVWDVLVTDLLLVRGGSGFGLIRHARSLGKFRHVVVFSGYVTDAVARRCLGLGADAVFKKSELHALIHYIAELPVPGAADRSSKVP